MRKFFPGYRGHHRHPALLRGGYPLFVQLRPSSIDAAASGEEILKALSFTGYKPDFRISESFSGEIQAPRRDAVLNVAGAAESPLYRRIWLRDKQLVMSHWGSAPGSQAAPSEVQ